MSGYNEDAYRLARESAIALPCPFERALLARCASCGKARRLLLAEREAITCTEERANADCRDFHRALHDNARFALHMVPRQPWPFGKEIRAQCGGIQGLAQSLDAAAGEASGLNHDPDIASLVATGLQRHGDIEHFPYSLIMRAVVHFEPRKRRRDP